MNLTDLFDSSGPCVLAFISKWMSGWPRCSDLETSTQFQSGVPHVSPPLRNVGPGPELRISLRGVIVHLNPFPGLTPRHSFAAARLGRCRPSFLASDARNSAPPHFISRGPRVVWPFRFCGPEQSPRSHQSQSVPGRGTGPQEPGFLPRLSEQFRRVESNRDSPTQAKVGLEWATGGTFPRRKQQVPPLRTTILSDRCAPVGMTDLRSRHAARLKPCPDTNRHLGQMKII